MWVIWSYLHLLTAQKESSFFFFLVFCGAKIGEEKKNAVKIGEREIQMYYQKRGVYV